MQRFHQILFVSCLIALSWLGMMAVHEMGHVMGAIATGARVERVLLHPLAISRTDVSPASNRYPNIVVWLGPIIGCALPLFAWLLIPQRATVARHALMFFAGFCLIANGCYIGIGAFDGVGDAGVMVESGSPLWTLFIFGVITTSLGLLTWHRLGSPKKFFADPSLIQSKEAYLILAMLLIAFGLELIISPR